MVLFLPVLQLSDAEGAIEILQIICSSLNIDAEECENLSLDNLMELVSKQPKEEKIKLMKTIGNASLDSEVFLPSIDEKSSTADIIKYYGIEDLNAIPKEERAKKLAEAIVSKKNEDLDENNESSLYNKYLSELKQGNFTANEIKDLKILGLNPDSVPEFKLKQMAKERVHTGYIKAFNNTNVNLLFDEKDLETFRIHIKAISTTGVAEEAHKNGVDTSGLATTIAMAAEDDSFTADEKREISNILVEYSEGLGVQYLEDDLFAAVSTSIYKNADTEHSIQYSNDYKDRSAILKEVLESVISSTTESEKKANLQEIYSVVSVNNAINDATSTQTNNTSSNKASALNYNSNEARNVADIRNASETYYSENGVTNPISNNDADVQSAHRSAHKIGTELSIVGPIRYNPDRIKKIVKDVNNSIGQFSNLSQEEQAKVNLYLTSAPPHALVSLMLTCNSEVQKFLLQYVSIDVIANTVSVDDISNFSGNIQEKLAEHVKSKIDAGTLKENQMTNVQEKIMEFYSKTV